MQEESRRIALAILGGRCHQERLCVEEIFGEDDYFVIGWAARDDRSKNLPVATLNGAAARRRKMQERAGHCNGLFLGRLNGFKPARAQRCQFRKVFRATFFEKRPKVIAVSRLERG